jgi:hypothetical protein
MDPIKTEAAVPEVKPGDNQGAAAPATQGEQKEVPLAALQEERNKRQSVEAKLNQLQAIFGSQIAYDAAGNIIPVTPQQQPNVAPQAPQQQEWGDVRKQLDQLWENDPRKAVQSELAMAINWYDNVNNTVEEEMDKVAEKFKDFQGFRPQIRQYLRRLPLDQRGRPGIVEAAYFLQKGQNFDTALSTAQAQMAERIRAGESVQGIGNGSAYTPQGEGRRWTMDEVKVAQMYNMTPEQYFGKK